MQIYERKTASSKQKSPPCGKNWPTINLDIPFSPLEWGATAVARYVHRLQNQHEYFFHI